MLKKWINSLWNQHQNIDEYINDQINAWVRTWDRCRGISNNLSTYSNFLFEYVLKYLVLYNRNSVISDELYNELTWLSNQYFSVWDVLHMDGLQS